MRARTFFVICLLACLATVIQAFAQEGHPLKGTWLGDWGPSRSDRNQVTVVMDWDGKQITGTVNPGQEAIPIQKASLDEKTWTVHFEADAKDRAGKTVHYIVEGKIENLGLYNRAITGTWNHDNVQGDFKLQRQ